MYTATNANFILRGLPPMAGEYTLNGLGTPRIAEVSRYEHLLFLLPCSHKHVLEHA